MTDTIKNWLLGLAGVAMISCAGAALSMWADVRDMKKELANQVRAERIAVLEGDLKAHELQAEERRAANEQRFAAVENRVKSLEWQRNRDQDRAR